MLGKRNDDPSGPRTHAHLYALVGIKGVRAPTAGMPQMLARGSCNNGIVRPLGACADG